LAGVTVVTIEQAVSAPLCTRTLGDFGARVLKIEHPKGGDFAREFDDVVDGLAAHFVWLNRGKESVTLNLRTPDGVALLHRLLERADVFVANLTPGATDRLGIGADDLADRYPRLISAEISGYGPGGPLSGKRAYDMLVGAETGVCAITGRPGAPAKPGPPFADGVTGLYAAHGLAAQRLRRPVGGAGRAAAIL
jgi:crotonobetainyl-CoA:carnitine CoA-transferase CaiB-like acyl-CoA transferase